MKNELINLLENKININDLTNLINEYIKIEKGEEPTSEQLTILVQLVSSNKIMLTSMVQNILYEPKKYNLDIITLLDKDKIPIKYYIEEIN